MNVLNDIILFNYFIIYLSFRFIILSLIPHIKKLWQEKVKFIIFLVLNSFLSGFLLYLLHSQISKARSL